MEQYNFKILAKYIHGSADSIDVDTYYVVDQMPDFKTAKSFCDSIKNENANLLQIDNGIVTKCYKGTIDECNNGLLATYDLHYQTDELLVKRLVERDVFLKCMRAVRGILSHLSRSQYRQQVKSALKGTWEERLNVLESVDLTTVDFNGINKHISGLDTIKVIAFQIGQALGLLDGIEFYTKNEIAEAFTCYRDYLYRKWTDLYWLDSELKYFVNSLRMLHVKDTETIGQVQLPNGCVYDLINEKKIR